MQDPYINERIENIETFNILKLLDDILENPENDSSDQLYIKYCFEIVLRLSEHNDYVIKLISKLEPLLEEKL